MSADLIEQLERYGSQLRDELATLGNAEATPRRRPPDSVIVELAPPRRSSRRWTQAAAVTLLVVGVGAVWTVRRVEHDSLVASPVDDATELGRPTDSEAFLARLTDVDYELEALPARAPTEAERDAVVSRLSIDRQPVDRESVTITAEFATSHVVVEYDVVTAEAHNHCRAIGRRADSGLELDGRSSCWSSSRPALAPDAPPSFSYGCRPALNVPGGSLFGRKDFTVDVELPPGSPGVILWLENGETVLARPIGDVVVYAGPVASRMEIFYANGTVHSVNTHDCL